MTNTITRHPLYQMQRRHIRWARTRPQSIRYTVITVALVSVALLFAWGLAVSEDIRYNTEFGYGSGIEVSLMMLTVLFAFTLFVLPPVLDLFALAFSVHAISREMNMQRWDLLGLAVPSQMLARALHEIANLRAWRVLVVLVTARLVSLVLLLLTLTVVAERLYDENALRTLVDLVSEFEGAAGWWVLVSIMLSFLLLVVVYLIEPFLRTRLVTAMGLVISARVRSLPTALLAGLAALMLLWLMLPMLVMLPAGLVVSVVNLLLEALLGEQAMELVWFVNTPLVIALSGTLLLAIYWGLEHLLLRDVVRRAP